MKENQLYHHKLSSTASFTIRLRVDTKQMHHTTAVVIGGAWFGSVKTVEWCAYKDIDQANQTKLNQIMDCSPNVSLKMH